MKEVIKLQGFADDVHESSSLLLAAYGNISATTLSRSFFFTSHVTGFQKLFVLQKLMFFYKLCLVSLHLVHLFVFIPLSRGLQVLHLPRAHGDSAHSLVESRSTETKPFGSTSPRRPGCLSELDPSACMWPISF